MIKLTIEQIDNELRKLMTEQPTFQYATRGARCFYHQGPTGDTKRCDGCIFGQAFQRLGITKKTLDECSRSNIRDFKEPWLTNIKPDYWQDIQTAQDQGIAWGNLIHYLPTP